MRSVYAWMSWGCGYAAVALLALLAGRPAAARADEDRAVRDAFAREYAPFAEKLRGHYRAVYARFIRTTEAANNTQFVDTGDCTFTFDHFRARSETKLVKKQTQEALQSLGASVVCRNSQYSFAVTPKGENDYLLSFVKVNADNERPLWEFCAPYTDYLVRSTYLDLAKDPEARFVEFGDARFEGAAVKRLVFRRPITHLGTKKQILTRRSLYFAPDLDWACVGYQFDLDPPSDPSEYSERRYSYTRGEGGFPALSRVERWGKAAADPGKLVLKEATTFSEFRPAKVPPESDFRLSAFGLPEPVGVTWQKPIPIFVWITAGAVAFALLAVLFRYLARREARAAVP